MDQAVAEGWNTRSITLAGQRFQGIDFSAIQSTTTGQDQTEAALGTGSTDEAGVASDEVTALGSQTDPVPSGVTIDTEGEVDRSEDVNYLQLTDNQIADLQQDYPNDVAGATKWLFDSLDSDSSYTTLFDEAARVHKGTGFQDSIKMVVQKADDALEATGKVTSAFGNTTVHPTAVNEAKESLMQDLDIDDATASKLIDIARDNLNSPLSGQFLTDANVKRLLRREKNLTTSLFGGGERILRRSIAVKQIASKFNISEERASAILNSMYPEQSETEESETASTLPDVDVKKSPAFDIEEAAEKQFRKRDDLFTGSEASGRPQTETKTDTLVNRKSKPNAIQLAMKYVDGTLTAEEAKALTKIVEGPDGAEIAMAIKRIRDRREAEKEVSAYRSRGGLMSR